MSGPRLLVLGEKPRRILATALGRSWEITVAHDGSEALTLLAAESFDVAFLADEGGAQHIDADFVQAAHQVAPETEIVTVSHLRLGSWLPGECPPDVYGFLTWPLDSELVVRTLRGAVERRRLRAEIEYLRAELRRRVGIRDVAS